MNVLQKVAGNSALTFLYIAGMGFTATLIYQVVTRQPIDSTILGLLYGIIAFAINSNGVKSGVDHTNETVQKVALAQYPLTPDGIATAEAKKLAGEQKP